MSSTNTLPSLYIPFVYTSTEDEKIRSVIELDYCLGKISYIDYLLKENADGVTYYSLYIHFETFNFDEITEKFLEHAKDKNDPPRLYYEYGKSYFWKVMLNTSVGKNTCPRVKLDYNKPSFKRDEVTIPSSEEPQHDEHDDDEPSLPVAPTLPVAPALPFALPVAPTLSFDFPVAPSTLPEGVTPLILPELCTRQLKDDDDVPEIKPEFKRTVFTPRSFQKLFPPQEEKRKRSYPEFDSRYRENDSKLLCDLSKKYYQSLADEAEMYMLDFYEGSSSEANNMFDGFEGSSLQATTTAV